MKKSTFFLMMMIISLNVFPNTSNDTGKNGTVATNNSKEMPAEVSVLLNRLDEIKTMDKSSLNSSEKKALRKEVRAINTSLKTMGNGVYLSVGAIIIVILLLILLL
jgi:hypothetical protein